MSRARAQGLGRLLVVACLTGFAGLACYMGTNPAKSPVATGPRGAVFHAEWKGENPPQFWGTHELIAVADTGLFMLVGPNLLLYRVGSPIRVRSRQAPGTSRVDLASPDTRRLQALSPYARYPFGLNAVQLDLLLDALGLDSLVVIRE